MSEVDELHAERERLLARVREMDDTLEGCDWCCGGGDEEMDEICQRLDVIEIMLAYKRPVESNDQESKA